MAESQREYHQRYFRTFKEELTRKAKAKYRDDLLYKLAQIVRFKKIRGKEVKDVRNLGCSLGELKTYLESQFKPGMNWENFGRKRDQWTFYYVNTDFDSPEELIKLFHYTNLQPVWFEDRNIVANHRLKACETIIDNLSKDNFCIASNKFLADALGVSKRTASKYVSLLKKKEKIVHAVVHHRNQKFEWKSRRLMKAVGNYNESTDEAFFNPNLVKDFVREYQIPSKEERKRSGGPARPFVTADWILAQTSEPMPAPNELECDFVPELPSRAEDWVPQAYEPALSNELQNDFAPELSFMVSNLVLPQTYGLAPTPDVSQEDFLPDFPEENYLVKTDEVKMEQKAEVVGNINNQIEQRVTEAESELIGTEIPGQSFGIDVAFLEIYQSMKKARKEQIASLRREYELAGLTYNPPVTADDLWLAECEKELTDDEKLIVS